MTFDFNRARQHLQSFNLRKLFIEEMGWDQPDSDLDIPYEGDILFLEGIAQKRGLKVFVCSPLEDGQIPDYTGRRKIETELRKRVHEHILIFTDLQYSRQVWQWVRREPGRPTTGRELDYYKGQSGEPLLQRLQSLVFTLEQEESIGIVDVTSRVRATFDVERITSRFYDQFKEVHTSFVGFLKGIPDSEDQRWYVSLTLNRLMFVYFIQKKLFLAGDENYLQTKLIESQKRGKDQFYESFICPLFFEGFAKTKTERKPEINKLLGDVPYLNGGIFQKHSIELEYGTQITIKDSVFEMIFDFFDQYRWHLDERPLRNDKEINPDVLGYIFEKYINQKEMGAYYTKEDITGYISRSTILPFLLDQAKKDYAVAFTGEYSVWNLLATDPNRYIFPPVQKGADLDLPPEIMAGINDVSKRDHWNKTAPEEYALPAETWREVVARRTRYEELYSKLISANLHEVNDLITYNLDIEQFTQDLIEGCEEPDLLRAFWNALRGIKVLDPTCGSGAFLFAALNILEPLYEACLERMRVFIAELNQSGENHRPEKFSDFREILGQVEKHYNERYFILKSIIVNNLYGVDIMEEAVEICKLRLFLKLIAQVEQAKNVEPLPDIDFNIRAGNTLVGFTSINEVEQALLGSGPKKRLPYPEEQAQIERIKEDADLANRAYLLFQSQQLEEGFVTTKDKEALSSRLHRLNDEMNRALTKTYGVYPDTRDFSTWMHTHKPFHWYVDFFGIMNQGGFSVIIGNPPYINMSKVRKSYTIQNMNCTDCPDVYAVCVERSFQLLNKTGRFGMILPISFQFSQDFLSCRNECNKQLSKTWVSTFSRNPAALFSAWLGVRNTICVGKRGEKENNVIYSTKLNRWIEDYRPFLFSTISFTRIPQSLRDYGWPRFENERIAELFDHLVKLRWQLNSHSNYGRFEVKFKTTGLYYISAFIEEPPSYDKEGAVISHTDIGRVKFSDEKVRDLALAIAVSKISLIWWAATGDDFHVTSRGLGSTPLEPSKLPGHTQETISSLSRDIVEEMQNNIIYTKYAGKWMGNYDIKYLRYLTDQVDKTILDSIGFSDYWEDIETAYASFMKMTGERPGTVREIPDFEKKSTT